MRISINTPSYKRYKVETLEYLSTTKIWVCESEYQAYLDQNKEYRDNIIKVPLGIQGNVSRIRNYILDQEFEAGNDVVVIVDDDLKGIYEHTIEGKFGYNPRLIKEEELLLLIQKYALICDEMGFKLFGVNLNEDKLNHKHFLPISTKSVVLGPFTCHLNNPIRYDEKLPLKEDYDLALQHLNKYRGILRINKFYYIAKQSKQSGGCATYRNFTTEKNQLMLLQKKWGQDIIKVDRSRKAQSKKQKNNIDYNPIIQVKIKGV